MKTVQDQPGDEHKMSPLPDYMPRYPGSARLKGKTALISGGDSGIGRATAVLYAREGANVAVLYKEEHRDAADTLDLIRREHAEGLLLCGDVGDKDFCRESKETAVNTFGGMVVVVANAAEQHAV